MNRGSPLGISALLGVLAVSGCAQWKPGSHAAHGTPVLEQRWAVEGLATPESVLYDSRRDRIYVSNMAGKEPGDGFISVLGVEGTIETLLFASGLNDPKGMGLFGDQLYVADVNEVVVLSVETGRLLNRYPVPEAQFLNDIAVDPFGIIYITDSVTKRLHKIENGYLRVAAESESFDRPNGLYVVNPVTLLLATSGGGTMGVVDLDTATLEVWADGLDRADGIAADGRGGYFVSTWPGRIFHVRKGMPKVMMLDTTRAGINSADIDRIPGRELLLVPTFHDHRVVAYTIRH